MRNKEDHPLSGSVLHHARWSYSVVLAFMQKFLDAIPEKHRQMKADELADLAHARYQINDFAEADPGTSYAVSDYQRDVLVPHKIEVFKAGLEVMSLPCFSYKTNPSHSFGESREQFIHQLLVHDLSKFSFIESIGYHCKSDSVKNGFKLEGLGLWYFERAWAHHKHHNEHHPEHWMPANRDGSTTIIEMPNIYVYEMVADWLGANRSYGDTPFQEWIDKNFNSFNFHPKTKELAKVILGDLGIKTQE